MTAEFQSEELHHKQFKGTIIKNFLEPAMFFHLAVLIYLCGKRPKVHAKQKGSKNFFRPLYIMKA
jgi:hypothetical protein